jgi:hypothetical protein
MRSCLGEVLCGILLCCGCSSGATSTSPASVVAGTYRLLPRSFSSGSATTAYDSGMVTLGKNGSCSGWIASHWRAVDSFGNPTLGGGGVERYSGDWSAPSFDSVRSCVGPGRYDGSLTLADPQDGYQLSWTR